MNRSGLPLVALLSGCGSTSSICDSSQVEAVARAEDIMKALTLTCGVAVPAGLRTYYAGGRPETLEEAWEARCPAGGNGSVLWALEQAGETCPGVSDYHELDDFLSLSEPRAGLLTWDWLRVSGVDEATARAVSDRVAGGMVLAFPQRRRTVPWAVRGDGIPQGEWVGLWRDGMALGQDAALEPIDRQRLGQYLAERADAPLIVQTDGDLALGALEPLRAASLGAGLETVSWVVEGRDSAERATAWQALSLQHPGSGGADSCSVIADLRPEGLWLSAAVEGADPVRMEPVAGCPPDGPSVCLSGGGLRPKLDALAVAEAERGALRSAVVEAWSWPAVEERVAAVRGHCAEGPVELRARRSVTVDLMMGVVARLGSRVEWAPMRR